MSGRRIILILAAALCLAIIAGLMRPHHSPRCPSCGSAEDAVPIVYGKPGEEILEAADRGRVVLGGCMVSPESPRWHCHRCGADWGHFGDP